MTWMFIFALGLTIALVLVFFYTCALAVGFAVAAWNSLHLLHRWAWVKWHGFMLRRFAERVRIMRRG